MNTRPQTKARRLYEDIEPSSELMQEEGVDTLLLQLSGFNEKQVKVQLGESGNLKVLGERPIGGNKWIRFQKEYQIALNCKENEIRATFEDQTLFVTMPKKVNLPRKGKNEGQETESKSEPRVLQPLQDHESMAELFNDHSAEAPNNQRSKANSTFTQTQLDSKLVKFCKGLTEGSNKISNCLRGFDYKERNSVSWLVVGVGIIVVSVGLYL